jgi:mono/diheme cytochrome c family protein
MNFKSVRRKLTQKQGGEDRRDAATARSLWRRAGILVTVGLLLGRSQLAAQESRAPESAIDFVTAIQSLFAQRCYQCHGPDEQEGGLRLDLRSAALAGGESGPVIVPRKSSESRLFRLVAGLEQGSRMPKKGAPLSDAEIGLIRTWIDQGGNWPEAVAEVRPATGSNWWSLVPAMRPLIPDVTNQQFLIRNPVDAFVAKKLEEMHLEQSPEADRPTLIRRVTFDLTGLPPTPDEVDLFVGDDGADAYERLVDQLLKSPRYGERWARHWLDAVHFGETHGYDKDKLRPNAWPYRDYVITSFNNDKSYSRFVQEQLAGDVLFPEEPGAIAGLGFIAAGPWDYVGHVELPIGKSDGLIARYNDRDDMVMTTISTFQSLTVHCARCHDHKFDPITQKDYYNLQAVFAGVDRAERPFDADPKLHQDRQKLLAEQQRLEKTLKRLVKERDGKTSSELMSLNKELEGARRRLETAGGVDSSVKSPSNGYHSAVENRADSVKWVEVDLGVASPLDELALWPAHPVDFADTPGFGFPIRFKVEISTGPEFAEPEVILDRSTKDVANPADHPFWVPLNSKKARFIRVTATRLWERTHDYIFALAEIQVFSGGTNVARGVSVRALDSIEGGLWAKGNLVDGYTSRGKLSERRAGEEVGNIEQLQSSVDRLSQAREEKFQSLVGDALRGLIASAEAELNSVTNRLAKLPKPQLVYAGASTFTPEGNFTSASGVRPVFVLARGDVKRPKEEAIPSGIPTVPGPQADFAIDPSQDEGKRRAALARWITDPANLLTRRSIVNRVWQYHFGKGIVETPNDFGRMGALPTHPQLLDWLAFWFLDNGESFKSLHRLIVSSAAYRQSSVVRPDAAAIDADNRYLWRMNRTRLEAEALRDSMLLVSGKLDLRMGGPSDRQFFFKDDHSPVYDYTRFDVDGPDGSRRSIYRHIVRSVPDPFMECLDAADACQLVARRYTTLTPQQALALLNNPFVLRQCEHFAERLRSERKDLASQVLLACRWALGRAPTGEEAKKFEEYAERNGLANLCRVLFNSPEFSFLD